MQLTTWLQLVLGRPFRRAGHRTALVAAGGLALLFLGPGLTGALVRLETRAAEVLLGPSRTEKLARRVSDLAESRAGVLDAADAERRRIERDLHDGAQQRLVSLAVNLGLARATLGDLPEDARKVIDEAHREAKEAIAELNNLVRGLHPAVLEDRGLDAALSGVAARLPIPVRVAVDLPQRPSPTVEAIAYSRSWRRPASRCARKPPTQKGCWQPSRSTGPTSPWSTCACRPASPTRECAPRW
ncbi:signal transduction histidine kinase [Streptomyces sp. SAI-144]|nr:signal transduction histidine kinase [Streptomyces sp. SAI-144]